jgi:hypothetical protein
MDEIEKIAELIKLAEERNRKLEETNDLRSESLKTAEKQLETAKQAKKYLEDSIKDTEKLLKNKKNDQQLNDTLNKQLEVEKQLLADANIELRLKKTELKDIEQKQRQVNEQIRTGKDLFKSMFSGDVVGAGSKVIGLLGDKIEKQLTKKLLDARMAGNAASLSMAAMGGTAIVGALFIFQKAIFDLAVQVGNAENAFMKATGASEDFARSLSDSFIETRRFGATTQETSAAMQSLFTNFTDFTMLNEQSVENLTKTATVLGKMGVSTDDFAKGIQNLTKAMGFNADAAAQQLLNLEKFAEELGVAPSKIASDFAGAGGSLAKFGDQGVETFKRLEIASKITGMEMQRILSITEKFDTFEGAATMAGKLNAALGGNFVNAMDLMMETDPVGRFEQIRDAILSTGMSFDNMTYFQKNMYKEMLGLQDVGELALLLSGRTDLMAESFGQSAQSYEEAAERAKTLASFQEQLQMLFVEMIPIMTPMIDLFRQFFQILQPLAPLIGLFGRLMGLIVMMGTIMQGGLLTSGFALFVGVVSELSEGIEKINTALDESIVKFSSFATRIFKTKNSPTIFEGVGMLADMFGEMDTNIQGTTVAVQNQTAAFNSTPVPAMAQAGAAGGTSTQTVQQPVNIMLNGEVVGKFVMETLGTAIKNISILQ